MQVTVVLDQGVQERLDAVVRRRGGTRASILRLAIRSFLDADEQVQTVMFGLTKEEQERTIAGIMEAARWTGFGRP